MNRIAAWTMASLLGGVGVLWGQNVVSVPENLEAKGLPPLPVELRQRVTKYLEFRTAAFTSWHPQRRELLTITRFGDVPQAHFVKFPGGARHQLTFLPEPVRSASFRPKTGRDFIFSQDTGGGEFFQLYRYEMESGEIQLVTDGKSRNTGGAWSPDGQWLAYASTRRNGADNDIYVVQPEKPETTKLVAELKGGGWAATDWSPDGQQLLLSESISINQSRLYLLDIQTGQKKLLTPEGTDLISYSGAVFHPRKKSLIYFTTDRGSEFHRLVEKDLSTGQETILTQNIPWDVESFELNDSGDKIAFVTNEEGIGKLHVISTGSRKAIKLPTLPPGLPAGLEWHPKTDELGFTFSSAQSSADVYSIDLKANKLIRWTESETGGLDPKTFADPSLVRVKSFDGLHFSSFLYRPNPKKFPGKRPVVVSIHGGPEGQTRPGFQGRNNFLLNELGVAILAPNVRGSSGFGKTFLTLDNGFKREDSVKDIGALLDWIATQPDLDADRVVVMGGSYGGYMVLASLVHFSDRLRAGIDIVGISNFITFLQNTQDYRRDLRRVEYGDERDPAMKAHLEKISPARQSEKIKKPLFVIQGKNDPRVPVTESEQMVAAIEKNGGKVWYLMAKDEGHGFAKKKNIDFQFLAVVQFLQEHVLK